MYQDVGLLMIVEDSNEDFEALIRVFKRLNLNHPIKRCVDGEEALEFIDQFGVSHQRPLLILLDLNLPGTDGYEVLAAIKGDLSLRSIPVLILTSSTNQEDVEHCYQLGANSYMQKPHSLEQLYAAIECLRNYWLSVALLPNRRAA